MSCSQTLLRAITVTLFLGLNAIPPEACFANFRWDDCGRPPVDVLYYWKPGSRCEVGVWRGCLPNINMFKNEYECAEMCIFNSRAQAEDYHILNAMEEIENVTESDYKNTTESLKSDPMTSTTSPPGTSTPGTPKTPDTPMTGTPQMRDTPTPNTSKLSDTSKSPDTPPPETPSQDTPIASAEPTSKPQ